MNPFRGHKYQMRREIVLERWIIFDKSWYLPSVTMNHKTKQKRCQTELGLEILFKIELHKIQE